MATLRMQPAFPASKGPLGPSNSLTHPQSAPNAPKFLHIGRRTESNHILDHMAQKTISSTPNPPTTTRFWCLPPLKIALRDTPVGCGKLARGSPKRWVPKWVNKVHREKKKVLSRMIPEHMGCPNKCFCRLLSSCWPVSAFLKSHNALKMRCFATKNGSNLGPKRVFPKMILHRLGCLNKTNEPILSPLQAILAPPKSENVFK